MDAEETAHEASRIPDESDKIEKRLSSIMELKSGKEGLIRSLEKSRQREFYVDSMTKRLQMAICWDEKYRITFGKFKGKTLGAIADMAPGYIVWLKEVAEKPIVKELYTQCQEAAADSSEGFFADDEWGDR